MSTHHSLALALRLARFEDAPALSLLMQAAIAELQKPYLDAEQIEGSFEIMGIDQQLIADRTYFVVEDGSKIAGCGGWSRRATLFGGDHSAGRDARLLDPKCEPAKVRAMYTHPAHVRRGIGRMILDACEQAAAAEGFKRVELAATMAGVPLYSACGYSPVEPFESVTASGARIPLVRMAKAIAIVA